MSASAEVASVEGAQTRGRLAESWTAVGNVMRHPQLRRAQLAFALAWIADNAFTVTLGIVAFEAGGAPAVGLVALLRTLPAALLSPFIGALADRGRRERVLAIVMITHATAIGYAAAILHRDGPVAVVYGLAVVATVAFTVFRPAHSALLPSLCLATRDLASSMVVRGFLDAAGVLLGPTLVGVLFAVADETAVFVSTSALSALAAFTLLRVRYEAPPRPAAARPPALAHDAVDGVRAVASHPELSLIFGLCLAQTFVRGALNVFIVVVAFDLLHTDASGVAALSMAVGLGAVLGSTGVSLLVGSRHLAAWLALALVLWGSPFIVLGAVPTQLMAFGLLAIVGIANAIIDIPLFTLPVRLASDTVLARVFAVLESLVAAGVGLGSIVTPFLIAWLGLRGALVAIGAILPALAAAAWRRLVALDRRLDVREQEIGILRSTPMLSVLPVASVEHLASRLHRRTVPAGACVFEQGERGSGFFTIVRGNADVLGDNGVVARLGRGDSFGEIALLRDVPRTATVRACGELELLELESAAFVDAVGGYSSSRDEADAVVARRLAGVRPPAVA